VRRWRPGRRADHPPGGLTVEGRSLAADPTEFQNDVFSALIVPVPRAEPVVGSWRARFDRAGSTGVPAHITVLYPFLPPGRLTAEVLAEIAKLVGARAAFDFSLARTGRFGETTLYVEPDPTEPFVDLTMAVFERFPEAPPYGGGVDAVRPHLTVGHSDDPQALDPAEAAVSAALPVASRVHEVVLITAGADFRWQVRAPFALG
jgi:hypothetical protein